MFSSLCGQTTTYRFTHLKQKKSKPVTIYYFHPNFEGKEKSHTDTNVCVRLHTTHSLIGVRLFRSSKSFISPGNDGRPSPYTERNCASNPCFHGVHCLDTEIGYKCGPCPAGHYGDGTACRRLTTCADRPCYPGNPVLVIRIIQPHVDDFHFQ